MTQRYFTTLVCTLSILLAGATTKRSLLISDFAGWQRIEQSLISNDGTKVVFETKAQKGDGYLIVYNALTGISDTLPHAHSAVLSSNSAFAVVKLRLPEDSLRSLKLAKTKKEDMPKEAIGIYTFANRHFQRIDSVRSFQLPEENSNWLSYLREGPKQNKKPTYTLVITDPVSGQEFSFEKADTVAIARKGSPVALLTASDTLKQRSLLVIDPAKGTADTLFTDSLQIRKLTFDMTGSKLVWLASRDTAKVKNYSLFAGTLSGNSTKTNRSKRATTNQSSRFRLLADSLTAAFPAGWGPSENGALYFSDDDSKLFFGTAPLQYPEPKDSLTDDEQPRLDLWSHTDDIIMPRQLKQLAQKKKQTYLAVYRFTDDKVIQLADTLVETIRLQHLNNGELALGINRKPYERTISWSSRALSDYYHIDLTTGKRSTLLIGGQHLQLSPDGKYAIWFDNDQQQYYTRELSTGKQYPVSSMLRASLTDELHDTPDDPRPYGVAGWTENDRHIVLYDRYDLWLTDPKGDTEPVRLTNGRENKIRFRYVATDKKTSSIALNSKILLSMVNEDTFDEGYASIMITVPAGKSTRTTAKQPFVQPDTLISGAFAVGSITKAANSDALIWSRQTVDRFPEIELSNLQFSESKVLSATNLRQAEVIWPTVELVSWTSFTGDSLRGLLYKPDNFDPKQKYPMMVYFYEKSSDSFHRYHYPQPSRSIISIPFYASNEYLVFVPDINYTTGFPGQNAYDAIVSGVQSLLNTRSYINAKAMGLQGQSWGGYQIAHLITQTDLFAAAMAGAPVSNMTSAYGGIRWGTGMSRMFQYENTQSRIGGTLWERPLHYIENSPLFHAPRVNTPLLMMHNDNDGAVPWYQGIEYFMALYRLGKPVWMLNYNGMDHNIEAKYWANRIDLSTRMFGFFNHYLKGEKKPEWMMKGIPAIEKGEELNY